MHRFSITFITIAACAGLAALGGCAMGPAALKASRQGYNDAIQQTRSEQLLLNLVRLQYREEPLFLDVGNVAAQFVFRQAADATGTINEGPGPINPDALDLGASVAFEERPTITLTPLQGADFAERLLKPLDLDLVMSLERSGWGIDRVLRLTVQKMNKVDNASGASGPTPDAAPRHKDFAKLCTLFRSLQQRGVLRIGHEEAPGDPPIVLPAACVTLGDVVEAQQQGYTISGDASSGAVTLRPSVRRLVWLIPDEAINSQEVKDIVGLLGLAEKKKRYIIRAGLTAEPDARREKESGGDEILVLTRSLMGAMFYLSQAVEVPASHREAGLVTTTRDAQGRPFDWSLVTSELLHVHSRHVPPRHAAVAVRHLSYWFYIDHADLDSKSTFALLGQLFALQAGIAASAGPVLTLPVGG